MGNEYFEKGLLTLASKTVPIFDLYSFSKEGIEWWVIYEKATGRFELK